MSVSVPLTFPSPRLCFSVVTSLSRFRVLAGRYRCRRPGHAEMSRETLEAVLTSGVVMTVPLLLAALGELFAEWAGVINIGVEGMMLVGALGGVVGAFHGHSPWLGLLAGGACGVALAALVALVVVIRGARQGGAGGGGGGCSSSWGRVGPSGKT